MSPNRPANDLGEVLLLAMEELDRIASEEGVELSLVLRTRIIHWIARAHDAGRFAPREQRKT
ncbi:MAG: hypothetical protein ACRD1X_17900 [Vicinamibacteria bacterium]